MTDERNNLITQYLDSLYSKAIDDSYIVDESGYSERLDKLFVTQSFSYREVVLVSITGRWLNPNYSPYSSFYSCNPRAIYGGAIKQFLMKLGIPHTKDGVLNIAKAAPGLNENWAKQRRPSDVANAVVGIIKYIEKSKSDKTLDDLGVSLVRRLLNEAKKVEDLVVEIEPSSDPDFLYLLCEQLIQQVPDAGNTPQKIAALLLKSYHDSLDTGVVVTGSEDRASVTSTTSRKPGDINEESADGVIYKVYEITVKKFDEARIVDSCDSILKYNSANGANINEIVVICREKDCPDDMKKVD